MEEQVEQKIPGDVQLRLLVQCQQSVTALAKHPSKVDFSWDAKLTPNGNIILVRGHVDMMNGFGAMIPQAYFCKYKDGTLKDVKLFE